jgi:hypothetical protein
MMKPGNEEELIGKAVKLGNYEFSLPVKIVFSSKGHTEVQSKRKQQVPLRHHEVSPKSRSWRKSASLQAWQGVERSLSASSKEEFLARICSRVKLVYLLASTSRAQSHCYLRSFSKQH